MKTLSIDIETYSGYDLSKSGVYKYAESPDFDILLFAYSVGCMSRHILPMLRSQSPDL